MSRISPERCDYCGRFIAYADFHNDSAWHEMITPDSHCSREVWSSLCRKHNTKENRDTMRLAKKVILPQF